MAKWKLTRQTYGSDQFTVSEGDEISIGRGSNNTITLTSLVVSRQHCILNAYQDRVTVKDLKSSNGTYLGGKKIPPNTTVTIHDSDLIGIGWSDVTSIEKIEDTEKFIFKLERSEKSIKDRLVFQNDGDVEFIDKGIKTENLGNLRNGNSNENKPNLKRKLSYTETVEANIKDSNTRSDCKEDDCFVLISDSDTETSHKGQDQVDSKKCNVEKSKKTIIDRLLFQNDGDVEFTDKGIKTKNLSNLRNGNSNENKPNLKIKLSYTETVEANIKDSNTRSDCKEDGCFVIMSDSDTETSHKGQDQVYSKKCNVEKSKKSIRDRLLFQNDGDVNFTDKGIKIENLVNLRNGNSTENKPNLKRKLSYTKTSEAIIKDSNARSDCKENDDSDTETSHKDQDQIDSKKCKLEPIGEVVHTTAVVKKQVKSEPNSNLDYDAFRVKQEYLSYEDEPITLDSDSESESERWLLRLSQSSPGKALLSPREYKTAHTNKDSIYSDHNDSLLKNQKEEFSDDMIKIPDLELDEEFVPKPGNNIVEDQFVSKSSSNTVGKPYVAESSNNIAESIDEVDNGAGAVQGISSEFFAKQLEDQMSVAKAQSILQPSNKMVIRIEASTSSARGKQFKEKSNFKSKRSKKSSPKKIHISNSQKEERKRKLKEIATKKKETTDNHDPDAGPIATREIIIKKTTSNRGAFLAESTGPEKSTKREDSPQKKEKHHKENDKKEKSSSKHKDKESKHKKQSTGENSSNFKKDKDNKTEAKKSEDVKTKESKSPSKPTSIPKELSQDGRIPLKDLKPLTESDNSLSGKPVSKVDPLPKPKKTVRFLEGPPKVRFFEIESGNQMKKTSLVKATLVDVPQMPAFSLEKISLMRILRWNPHWLDEQANNVEPPPILGHNEPLSIMHFFKNHTQYVQVVGDLLLMEIWECLSQAHVRKRDQEVLEMKIESLPNVPSERAFDIIPLSVNYSVLKTHIKLVPRIGELMIVTFGPENMKNHRFFYVSNVRCLPSPPTNKYAFFSISLHTVYTDKMKTLRRGEMIIGKSLAYIKNELLLFEAMEYLRGSPLVNAILRPDPKHFTKVNNMALQDRQSQWTATLNKSQLEAVSSSVAAAFSERPSIQLIQGPPGTGKSSVICSTVMTYYYDVSGKRRNNLGKILICASSNAAVDELVIRLLNIRQSLPKPERFRMVRVGRPEAMHPRARELSSQNLVQREAARCHDLNATPHLEELGRLEARLNMWKSTAQEAKDPGRIAYCQSRISQVMDRIAQLRGVASPSGEMRNDQLVYSERRIIEGADIVVTTLASAANQKMRGLKGRIALCIVDEAGQAIEPETLIPLTLDITTLALIGDPQQLPGFICSQRAKKHGLGESLFSRLTSSIEHWNAGSPIILLDVQYRMHPQIADYPNRAFYGGKVKNSVTTRSDLPFPPYSVVCISSGDKGQDSMGANEMEAWGAGRVALALNAEARVRGLSLALVTPYQGHRDLLRHTLTLLQNKSEPPIEVATVDSFQGQERDVIVVSLARSQGVGFLTDAGRVNVMLSRARHSLVVCLNPNALMKNNQWRTLIEDAQNRNAYKFLPNQLCQPATSNTLANDNVLQYL